MLQSHCARRHGWQTTSEALLGQDRQFDFVHVEPAALIGRVKELQLAHDAPRFG